MSKILQIQSRKIPAIQQTSIDFLYDSLDKNAEMIAEVKTCFRYLLDLHRKVKETVKIEEEQSIKFNVDREINGARVEK